MNRKLNKFVFLKICLLTIEVVTANSFMNFAISERFPDEYCAYRENRTGFDEIITSTKEHSLLRDINSSSTTAGIVDPIREVERVLNKLLFGQKANALSAELLKEAPTRLHVSGDDDPLAHFVTGNVKRAEMYGNRSGVHLPRIQYIQPGHCRLRIEKDLLQTAVNAFAIFTMGTVSDILELPSEYVLASARAISMIKLSQEKYAATWDVVKGEFDPDEVTYETLELYRPLFKYVNAREMANLNLSDSNIVSYIGTHPDLNRHQVGVIAKKYIHINPHWCKPMYLNLMNNLLCGVPMAYMRNIDETYFLQLSHQVFYHIHACDPLQRRFYLKMMTRTQALGKAYSWSSRDVSRLGLLLAEVTGPELSTINPNSMSAISAQIMMEMSPVNLRFLTEVQLRYIEQKSLNILARKLKTYQDQRLLAAASHHLPMAAFILTMSTYLINFNGYKI